MRRSSGSGSKILVTYLMLIGFIIGGYWVIQLSGSFLFHSSGTIRNSNYIIWHIIAELITSILSIIAAYLVLIRHPLGKRLAMFTCGMLLYTGLNSIGWGSLHDPGLLTIFMFCSIGAFFGLFYLIGQDEI
ncbi:MAG: hypothetical protein J7K40_06020 [candidate division Zixibacteria bacterium]|nr:hypothetical protein [candidate division Zixibacteria bacterium]